LLVVKGGCHLRQLAGALEDASGDPHFEPAAVIEINSVINRHVSSAFALITSHCARDRTEFTGTCDLEFLVV
jgi:hypothetical protein